MNNLPYPYFPGPFGGMPQFNLEEEINNIKRELFKLNERIEKLFTKEKRFIGKTIKPKYKI